MKTISVISSKGGVGKTMISVSLIDHAAKAGKKVIAVDADVNAPALAIWFDNITQWNEEKEISIFPLPKKFQKCKNLKLLCDGKELPINHEKRGTALLAKGYTPSFADYTIDFVKGDIDKGKTGSGKVVEGTIELSDRGDYDLRIIDTAPGTGYPVITAINNSDYVVIVTESTQLGFDDMKKLIEIVKRKNYGVFVNKILIEDSLNQIKDYVKDKYLGSLKYDPDILLSLEEHKPPVNIIDNPNFINFLEMVLEK
jgi:MinD superfamily P-loop ATPase